MLSPKVPQAEAAQEHSLVEALLPNSEDGPLLSLANTTFVDDGVDVAVSPVDQLLMAFSRRLLSDAVLGRHGVVLLPRSQHRSALVLAIASHLLCRQPPARLAGPVILIGFDVNLAGQLRSLGVQNYRRMGLAAGNPLSAHRLTHSGELRPVVGSVSGSADNSLIYFNTRIGRPQLTCRAPLVVLDATSVVNPAARIRALDWALERGPAAIVSVGDIGDDGLVRTMSEAGVVPSVLTLTAETAKDLTYELGQGKPSSSTLSSASNLTLGRTQVSLHRVGGVEINDAINEAFSALASKPNEPTPVDLELPVNMLRNGMRLAARAEDYRSACIENTRPGELPNTRRLDRLDCRLPGSWQRWQKDRLGSLVVGARSMWREIDEANPKLTELWRLLDELERTTTGTIAIRCHSKAAVRATLASLSSGERSELQDLLWQTIEDRVKVVTFKERFAAGSLESQVLTGAPPPWHFSVLCGIEAPTTHILCYDAEVGVLTRQGERFAEGTTKWQGAICRSLSARVPETTVSPVTTPKQAEGQRHTTSLSVPGLGLAEILDRVVGTFDPEEVEAEPTMAAGGSGSRVCMPVRLGDGRTWWCIDEHRGDTPVLIVDAGGHGIRAVRDLRPGDRIVVPAGEGTESIHARLVAASRDNVDVQGLDLILSQFRSAARVVLEAHSRTEAIELVRAAGAEASGQLPFWASGVTIAPHEPHDVEAVFQAAKRTCPDLRLIYAVANSLRQLNRWLGVAISAIKTGRGEEDVEKLRRIVGPVADEILDEFVVAVVDSVGKARTVAGSIAGRIR